MLKDLWSPTYENATGSSGYENACYGWVQVNALIHAQSSRSFKPSGSTNQTPPSQNQQPSWGQIKAASFGFDALHHFP